VLTATKYENVSSAMAAEAAVVEDLPQITEITVANLVNQRMKEALVQIVEALVVIPGKNQYNANLVKGGKRNEMVIKR
jgi:hypothetical protein